MFNVERIVGNFLLIVRIAVATCCEPPYSKSPTTWTVLPDFIILPLIPITSFVDFGFNLEKTKFVWTSGIS